MVALTDFKWQQEKGRNSPDILTRVRLWFVALVAYYVIALYLVPSSAKVERFSFTYFALVIPAWIYVLCNWRSLIWGYTTASKLMALFAVLAAALGALRSDWSLAYNSVFLAAMAITILNARVYLTVKEFNWVFLGCVLGSVAVYVLGLTIYGFFPGQAEAPGCHAAMNWRISLFRVTAESAMFSLVIIMVNMGYGQSLNGWIRALTICSASYFLIYSGVRSIVLPALMLLPICAISVLRWSPSKVRHQLLVGFVAAALIILFVPLALGANFSGFWKNYFLKTETCDYLLRYSLYDVDPGKADVDPGKKNSSEIPSDWYGRTLNRHCASIYQLGLFISSPLGNRDVQPKSDQQLVEVGCSSDQLYYFCSTCNFSTYWLARAGISAAPLLLCFLTLLLAALRSRNVALPCLLAAFGIVSLGWGGMFVPYNFMFLILLALPAFAAANEDKIPNVGRNAA